jgi:hypothetical protein
MRPTPGRLAPAENWLDPRTWPNPDVWLAQHGVPRPLTVLVLLLAVPVVTRAVGWAVATIRPARVAIGPPFGAPLPCRHQVLQEESSSPRWGATRRGTLLIDRGSVEWRPEANGGGWRARIPTVSVIDVHSAWWVSGPSVEIEIQGQGGRRLIVYDDQRVNHRFETVNRFRDAAPARALARALVDQGANSRCPTVARWRIRRA